VLLYAAQRNQVIIALLLLFVHRSMALLGSRLETRSLFGETWSIYFGGKEI
jgi:hypothetical protein